MVSYDTLLKTFRAELKEQERYKKDMIIKLTQKLEEEKYPTNDISARLTADLDGYIGKSYIAQVLDKKYKHLEKAREKEQKATVMNTTEGQTVNEVNPEEQEAKEQFTNEFNQALNSRKSESKDLNEVVVRELDKQLEYTRDLEARLKQTVSQEDYEKLEKRLLRYSELIDSIEVHIGSFIKFAKNEDGELFIEDTAPLVDGAPEGSIEINLIKFKKKIKESLENNYSLASIEYENHKAVAWK
jgi:hypothetical protein